MLACPGGFTEAARRFAGDTGLALLDDDALVQRLAGASRVAIGVPAAEPISSDSPSRAAACPRCGGAMIERTARRGAKAGTRFLGCSDCPSCRGTRMLGVLGELHEQGDRDDASSDGVAVSRHGQARTSG